MAKTITQTFLVTITKNAGQKPEDTAEQVRQALQEEVDEQYMESVHVEDRTGYFIVSNVAREDLESQGFDASHVDDATMQNIADKMGDSFCDGGYWEALEVLAEHNEIPRKNKAICTHCATEYKTMPAKCKQCGTSEHLITQ